MGFDNECILNIQSLAGEYFCPVCRLLVYPNEALQSQCTHLYCKPCLTYIVGTTRACPYDGYLVTEADSKPLLESNKALAETIGKIAVHCLYHRSGCQWQGPLSECTSHCSGCAFGNSPVVCNRCGIQIVHRQVQEHAQNCPGVQTQAPQIEGVQDTAATATSANAKQTQNANQSGASASQAQTSQTVAAVTAPPSGQDPNLQANANSQVHAVASAAVPTPEQWYQQQYQQYYQQYPGYDPYQQPYQTYYPNQQQAIQQYQQHPPHMMGQQQPQVYSQSQPQPQPQPLPQPQTHIQSQPQVQPQAPPPPQTQPQTQIQPHAQPQPLQHVHAPVVAQASVNPQHQLLPAVQPPAQMQSQAHPPQPHGHPHPQPQPYAGAQPHPQPHPIQPHSQQHIHISQYQQPQSQMQHTQSQIQPQTQSLPQMQPQIPLQAQPQSQLPHPHPQLHPPPSFNQHANPNAQPQTQPPLANAVTGHQSFPQPQVQQQMQFGAQQPPQMHPQGGSIPQHPIQLHGQFPQQPPQMRPPQSHVPVPNQQRPVLLPPQVKVPSMPPGQQQPIHSHAQQPGHPGHQRPVMQPMQQPVPQHHLQHQQPFPGQPSGTVQNQLHPHGHFVQQQQQSQLRPQAPPHSVQQNSLAYMSSQQNAAPSHGLPPHQSQNYAARPMMLNHGAQSLPFSQSPAGFSAAAQVRPIQIGANQPTNQNYPMRTNNQLHISSEQQIVQSGSTLKPTGLERQGEHMPEKSVADQKDGLPSEKAAQKDLSVLIPTSGPEADSVEVKNFKSETDVQKPIGVEEDNNSKVDMYGKDTCSELHAGGNTSAEPAIKHIVKKEVNESRLESSSGGKSIEIVAAERKDATDVPQRGERSMANDTSSQQAESVKEQVEKLPKDAVDAGMLVSGGADKGSQAISLASAHIPDSSTQFQERNSSQSQPTPQGPGVDEFRSFPSHGQVQGKGFMHPTHPFPPTDPGRHHHMPVHYGPSTHQQRPSGAAMLQSALPPGPPLHAQVIGQPPNVLRSQGSGDLPPPGQPLNPPDHFLPPVLKQPHGSFHPEIASGGIPGPSSASFGRGPSHFGPPERTFESQSVAPQGHYNQGHVPPLHAGFPRMSQGENPGSFNSLGGIMGRAPPYGAEGQIGPQRPINPIGSEIFSDQRSRHLDGRQPDSHLPGSFERAPFGQSPGIESNIMRMNEVTGTDSSSKVGLRDEKFKRLKEEGMNRIPIEPARRVDRGEFEDMKQFPRHPHLDTEPSAKFGSHHSSTRLNDREPHGFSVDAVSRPLDKAPHGLNYETGLKLDPGAGGAPRFLPPYHPGGSNDAGDRARPVGPDGFGRGDSTRTHPDFLRPGPGFGQHHMDRLTPRSPGREYPGFSARDFGGLSGYPRNHSGLDDFEGREPRPFGEGPRSFNFPSGPVGNSFPESRFPLLPGHLRRVEFDGPGNVRRSDLNGQDILPSHLRRGEILGPRNLPGHLRFGEPAGFGAFPGHARMGDLDGSGNLPHQLPFGEPFGGNKSGHPRLGEPGFRSSYSLTGGMDPFDNSRKRKPASMGWCRICKIDCETVEGLDLHSQTREHQKVAMDMVISIKQQNAKKQKTSNDHSSLEEPSKSRGSGYEVHGNKP